ncbi:MAG: PEGA domain-containing protein [Isosphaeraceae bacterium]
MLARQTRRWLTAGLSTALLVGLSGCVERRYTIRSNPPGALAIVNGEEIGRTPVSKNFTFYGDRDITLMMDGFETQRIIQPVKAPWYDNLLTEFFSENVVPFTIRDEREWTYQMVPATMPATNDILNRGQALRTQAQAPPPPRRRGLLSWFGF